MSDVAYEETRFGFIFGAAHVERCLSTPDGGTVTTICTRQGRSVHVYVSPKGRALRVYDDFNGEWKPEAA